MGKRQVWYLAQSEGGTFTVPDTPCTGALLAGPLTPDSPLQTKFPAPYHFPLSVGGHTMVSYWLDGHASGFLTGPILGTMPGTTDDASLANLDLSFPVPVGKTFDDLVVFYDAEGGANLNVAAWTIEGDTLIVPTQAGGAPVLGTDAVCPIAKIVEYTSPDDEGSEFLLDSFVWSAAAFTRHLPPHNDPGAWNCQPGDTVGTLEFHAKKTISFGNPARSYRFVRWEFGSLNPTFVDRMDVANPYAFGGNTFAGLIAYYERHDPDLTPGDVPDYKPGEITIIDWINRHVWSPLLRGLRTLFGRSRRG